MADKGSQIYKKTSSRSEISNTAVRKMGTAVNKEDRQAAKRMIIQTINVLVTIFVPPEVFR